MKSKSLIQRINESKKGLEISASDLAKEINRLYKENNKKELQELFQAYKSLVGRREKEDDEGDVNAMASREFDESCFSIECAKRFYKDSPNYYGARISRTLAESMEPIIGQVRTFFREATNYYPFVYVLN